MFGAAWFIARRDLAWMLRQRETLLWVFLMPLLFFYFIGTVTGGFGDPRGSADRPDPLALKAPADAGFALDELVRRLEQQNYRVVRTASDEELQRYARVLVVPDPAEGGAALTESVLAGNAVALKFDRRGDELAANFDRVRVARAVYAVLADLAVVKRQGGQPTPDAFANLAAMPRALSLRVTPAGRREDPPTGFAQAIPGTLVMFTMLVLLTSGSITLVIERQQGLLRRLASTPISPVSIVLGKWLGRMVLGLVQIAFGMLVGTLLFRMDWGASLPMVGVVLLVWATFNASLAILLAQIARTEAQMAGVGVLTTMLLAALGGCWWPIEITPAWMQRLALFLPTGWAMDATHKLVNFGYDAAVALPHAAALVVAALVVSWLGARTFRYE